MARIRPFALSCIAVLALLAGTLPSAARAQDPTDPDARPPQPEPQPEPGLSPDERAAVEREIETLRGTIDRLHRAGADEGMIHELEAVIGALERSLHEPRDPDGEPGEPMETEPREAVPPVPPVDEHPAPGPLAEREARIGELHDEIARIQDALRAGVKDPEEENELQSRLYGLNAELEHLESVTTRMRELMAELDAATQAGDWDHVRNLASQLRRLERSRPRRQTAPRPQGQWGDRERFRSRVAEQYERMLAELQARLDEALANGEQELADALAERLEATREQFTEAMRRADEMELRLQRLRDRRDRNERDPNASGTRNMRFVTVRGGVRYDCRSEYNADTGELKLTVEVTGPQGKDTYVFDSVEEMKQNLPALGDIELDPARGVLGMGGGRRDNDAQPGQWGRMERDTEQMRAFLGRVLDMTRRQIREAEEAGDAERARELREKEAQLAEALEQLGGEALGPDGEPEREPEMTEEERRRAELEARKAQIADELAGLQAEIDQLGTDWQRAKEQNDADAMADLERRIAEAYRHLEGLHEELDRLERDSNR